MSQPPDYSQCTILYVDDEEQALKYFRKGLLGEFKVLTAANVAAANVILDAQADQIAVVITDQRMPGLPGTALLARVRENWPNITRILVTAYAELESAIDAVNSGSVFKYITKPVDWDDLRAKLAQAVEQHLKLSQAAQNKVEDPDAVRRQIVADRVRSLSHMASGINHHVRNSITALSCFLEEADPSETGGAGSNPYLKNLWTAATEERDQLIDRIDEIHRWLSPAAVQSQTDVPVRALVQNAIAKLPAGPVVAELVGDDAGLSVHIATEPTLQTFSTLIKYAAEHGTAADNSAAAPAHVSVLPVRQFRGNAVVPIRIVSNGQNWSEPMISAMFTPFDVPESDPSELGLAMTAAFSFIYQCGGDILVHASAPLGPGFEVLLPLKPVSAVAA